MALEFVKVVASYYCTTATHSKKRYPLRPPRLTPGQPQPTRIPKRIKDTVHRDPYILIPNEKVKNVKNIKKNIEDNSLVCKWRTY